MSLFIWSEIQMWVAGYVQQYQLTGSKSAAVRACNHAPVPPQASPTRQWGGMTVNLWTGILVGGCQQSVINGSDCTCSYITS